MLDVTNFAFSTLGSDIVDASTTFTVADADADKFPTGTFRLTIWSKNRTRARDDAGVEIIDCTRSGSTLTIVTRALESTTQSDHDSGDYCGVFLTAGIVQEWLTAIATSIIPSLTGNSGKFITNNGAELSWTDVVATLTGIQTLTNKTLTSPTINNPVIVAPRSWDGWWDANESWSYASANTITVPAGATTKYQVGDRIKITQTTPKYFYVTAVADTLLTVYAGTVYTVANAAITSPQYSHLTTPVGFPRAFTFTPNWTNYTPGSGTNVGLIHIAGTQAWISFVITYGAGSSMGTAPTMTLPVAISGSIDTNIQIGLARIYDVTPGTVFHGVVLGSGNVFVSMADTTYVQQGIPTSTVPMTWATGDQIWGSASYLIA